MGISLDKDYIDLADVLGRNESYTDFEGLASVEHVVRVLVDEDVQLVLRLYDSERHNVNFVEVLRTLLAHWVYENLDQGDYSVTIAEAVDFLHTTAYVLGSRHWMKLGDLNVATSG